jgi:hypothetical protein
VSSSRDAGLRPLLIDKDYTVCTGLHHSVVAFLNAMKSVAFRHGLLPVFHHVGPG